MSSDTTSLLLHSYVYTLLFGMSVEDADGQRSENAAIYSGVQSKYCYFTSRAKLRSFGFVIFELQFFSSAKEKRYLSLRIVRCLIHGYLQYVLSFG